MRVFHGTNDGSITELAIQLANALVAESRSVNCKRLLQPPYSKFSTFQSLKDHVGYLIPAGEQDLLRRTIFELLFYPRFCLHDLLKHMAAYVFPHIVKLMRVLRRELKFTSSVNEALRTGTGKFEDNKSTSSPTEGLSALPLRATLVFAHASEHINRSPMINVG